MMDLFGSVILRALCGSCGSEQWEVAPAPANGFAAPPSHLQGPEMSEVKVKVMLGAKVCKSAKNFEENEENQNHRKRRSTTCTMQSQ